MEQRADYGNTKSGGLGALIESVEEGSPAWKAGLEPGMIIEKVNGVVPKDLIDWRWEADGSLCELEVSVPGDDELYECVLERESGEDWGVDFVDVLFDGIKTCVNACQFCFMAMLPEDMRPSLSIRDDDYRLSFLQGNFVTLTNLTDEDVERIISHKLEPMNVSLHAISPDVRRNLIGARAARGIEVLEKLMDAGIEIHGQIVLCPNINDGEELDKTLDWVEAHQQITSLAIVPLGYTKDSKRFTHSYSDDVELSRSVVKIVEPYQERARASLGITRFQLSDEFYVDAQLPIPPAYTYDGYPQFYDGIGMLRSFLDEAEEVCSTMRTALDEADTYLSARSRKILLIVGEAAQQTIQTFCDDWSANGNVSTFAVRNDFFGGDVNVTGLICAVDLLAQVPEDLTDILVVLPEVMFNFDKVTLDGMSLADLTAQLEARGAKVIMSIPGPTNIAESCIKALKEWD